MKHVLGHRSRTMLGVALLASLPVPGGAGPLRDLLQKRQADVLAIVSRARELPPPEKRRLEEADGISARLLRGGGAPATRPPGWPVWGWHTGQPKPAARPATSGAG